MSRHREEEFSINGSGVLTVEQCEVNVPVAMLSWRMHGLLTQVYAPPKRDSEKEKSPFTHRLTGV
jgi:hypothetical protein